MASAPRPCRPALAWGHEHTGSVRARRGIRRRGAGAGPGPADRRPQRLGVGVPAEPRLLRGGSRGRSVHRHRHRQAAGRAGQVGAQFWSVYVSDDLTGADAVQGTLEQIDWVYRLAARYPDDFGIARSAADVEAARAIGRIASLLGAEGGHSLNDSPAALRMFARLGVRYLTLTHVHNTTWADSGTDEPEHGGLTPRGVDYVHELNRLGMLVDLSHVSPATAHAALDASDSPVIFSHSSCRALSDHPRNVPDDVLCRLAANGGVLMLTFVPQFLSEDYSVWFEGDRAGPAPVVTLTDVADHVEHARRVAGMAHIGLGGDFDGTDEFPAGLEGVDGYPALLSELARRDWSAADLAALAGANVLRVLRETDAAFAAAGHAASGASVPRLVR
ncbi:dipeptidase [Cryobacterium sandaracinum]|uniref:dipeptidase n=1 Tax=Cryobacterium sandaracinum TaxID=1259247 RepID=UPI0030BA0B40